MRRWPHGLLLAALLAALLADNATAASADEAGPTLVWYKVEVLLFLRDGADPDGTEALRAALAAAPLAADSLALRPQDGAWPLPWTLAALLQSPEAFPPQLLWPPLPGGADPAWLTEPAPPLQVTLVPPPQPPADAPAAAAEPPAKAEDVAPPPMHAAWQLLPDDQLTLRAAARRIDRAREYSLAWHGAWLEPFVDADRPGAGGNSHRLQVLLEGIGEAAGHDLVGTLRVRRSRFLHLAADLRLGLPPGQQPELLEAVSAPPALFPAPVSVGEPARSWVQVSAYRRMRSGELHYIDHPLIGVLLRYDPVP